MPTSPPGRVPTGTAGRELIERMRAPLRLRLSLSRWAPTPFDTESAASPRTGECRPGLHQFSHPVIGGRACVRAALFLEEHENQFQTRLAERSGGGCGGRQPSRRFIAAWGVCDGGDLGLEVVESFVTV